MTSEIVKQYLEGLKKRDTLDAGFIDALLNSNETDEDADVTSSEIIKLIKQRYAQNKENKT
jgi:hypothetical protein